MCENFSVKSTVGLYYYLYLFGAYIWKLFIITTYLANSQSFSMSSCLWLGHIYEFSSIIDCYNFIKAKIKKITPELFQIEF